MTVDAVTEAARVSAPFSPVNNRRPFFFGAFDSGGGLLPAVASAGVGSSEALSVGAGEGSLASVCGSASSPVVSDLVGVGSGASAAA